MKDRITQADAARYLRIPYEVLRRMRIKGRAPKHIILGSRAYYTIEDLDEFVLENTVSPTEESGNG